MDSNCSSAAFCFLRSFHPHTFLGVRHTSRPYLALKSSALTGGCGADRSIRSVRKEEDALPRGASACR
jgi:hypothetical protein